MQVGEFVRPLLIALGIGGAVVGGVAYNYHDTEDRVEQSSAVPLDKLKDRDLYKVTEMYSHHTTSKTLNDATTFHTAPKDMGGREWDAGAYSYGSEDCKLICMRMLDTKGNQASKNNTASFGYAFSGDFTDSIPSKCNVDQFKFFLYSTLKLFPRIQKHRPHNKNRHSNTECPGRVEEVLRKEGLYFESRSEILWFMELMERRMLNPCMDEQIFEDSEPC